MRRVLVALIGASIVTAAAQPPAPVEWRLDNLSNIGGVPATLIGAPAVVATEIGPAVRFNGASDGLLLERNPLEGLSQFTIEVLLAPDTDGPVEQRFLHAQESEGENRALVELRLNAGRWALDSYVRHGDTQLTLLDLSKTHRAGEWHVSATTFDGAMMRHFVDGVEQGSGAVAFRPLGRGRTSIGVRQNRVSWFKGRIHTVRITPSALPPSRFMTVPQRVMALWPEGVPNQKPNHGAEQLVDGRVTNVHDPSLTYYPAQGTPNGTAMILCAGGSYARLAMANEVAGLTPRLTKLGIAVFALKYRLAEYGHPAPLQDVLRAIRTVRSRASEFGVRTDRIGVFGASAGGHLAASAAAWFDAAEGRTGDRLDAISGRPDFVALLYPVVTMTGAVCACRFAAEPPWRITVAAAGRSPVDRSARASGHAAVLHRAHVRGSIGADREQHGAGARAARERRAGRVALLREGRARFRRRSQIWVRLPNGRSGSSNGWRRTVSRPRAATLPRPGPPVSKGSVRPIAATARS